MKNNISILKKKLYLAIITLFLVAGILGVIGRFYHINLSLILFIAIAYSAWYISDILKKIKSS